MSGLDPETVPITGGSITIFPADLTPVHREPDGNLTYGDPRHVHAMIQVRLFSDPDGGIFTFDLTPAQARAVAAAAERLCPDAEDTAAGRP